MLYQLLMMMSKGKVFYIGVLSRLLFLGFVITFNVTASIAQVPINLRVVGEDGAPVAYCSVGVYGKQSGYISDVDGYVRIRESNVSLKDSLLISHVGFKRKIVIVDELFSERGEILVVLEPLTIDVGTFEVVDVSRFKKDRLLGSQKAHSSSWRIYDNDLNYGEVFCNYFPINRVSLLQEVSVKIKQSSCQEVAFRLRVFESVKGMPTKRDILTYNVIAVATKSGWLSFDTREQQLVLDKDVFVGVEFLYAKGCKVEEGEVSYPYSIHAANYKYAYYRTSLTNEWMRFSSGIALQLHLRY